MNPLLEKPVDTEAGTKTTGKYHWSEYSGKESMPDMMIDQRKPAKQPPNDADVSGDVTSCPGERM